MQEIPSEDKRLGEVTTRQGEKVGGENTFYSRILVSKWNKVVREGWGGSFLSYACRHIHKASHDKEVWVNQGRQGSYPNQ